MSSPPAPLHPRLRGLIATVGENYPLPNGETAVTWQIAAAQALDLLASRGLLIQADRQGAPLASHLQRLATAPLGAGLDLEPGRGRLLGELARNLVAPGRINQGHKGTCAVTCVESYLAIRSPAEYARLCVGLAVGAGAVELADGSWMRRDEERLAYHPNEARRGPVSRLLQVAMMQFAHPELDYRNREDAHFEPGTQKSTGTGVTLNAFDRLLDAVTGEPWSTLTAAQAQIDQVLAGLGLPVAPGPSLARDGMDILHRALQAGDACFVTLDTPASREAAVKMGASPAATLPHKVRVVGQRDGAVLYEDPLDPEDPWIAGVPSRVLNPQGLCAMDTADFRALMVELSFKKRYARPAAGGRPAP